MLCSSTDRESLKYYGASFAYSQTLSFGPIYLPLAKEKENIIKKVPSLLCSRTGEYVNLIHSLSIPLSIYQNIRTTHTQYIIVFGCILSLTPLSLSKTWFHITFLTCIPFFRSWSRYIKTCYWSICFDIFSFRVCLQICVKNLSSRLQPFFLSNQ